MTIKDNNKKNVITFPSVLLVEGIDEKNLFKELLKKMGITDVQIEDAGGTTKFKDKFDLIWNLYGRRIDKIGFIRDAEKNPAKSAYDSICGTIKNRDLPIPSKAGEVVSGINEKRVGIFIMPDNEKAGMLEDLCLLSIQEEAVNTCVESYINCFLKNFTDDEKSNFNRSKAHVQTFLASKQEIANRLGIAAQKGYWNFEHPCFKQIKEFINTLFN